MVLRAHWTFLNNFGCSEKFGVSYLWLCELNKDLIFFIQDVSSRMCWQKFILFSLAQKGVFMTISRGTVLRIHWSVDKCFGCSEKFRIIIYGYVGNKNSPHFIQDIPTCIVLTKIRFDHMGTEMDFWVHMIPIPWWISKAWFSQLIRF